MNRPQIMKRPGPDDWAIIFLCTAVFAAAGVIVGFQIREELKCEAVGGIPVRGSNFPTFVDCIK